MSGAVFSNRTQISLSDDLKRLVEARGMLVKESLSEYLRRAAILRMVLEDASRNDLQLVAKTVVGSVAKAKSGWKSEKDIVVWQRRLRRDENRHRS